MGRKRKSRAYRRNVKKKKITHGNHTIYLKFPFSRAVVKKDKNTNKPFKVYEQLRPQDTQILRNKRIFVAESQKEEDFFKDIKRKDKNFVGVHPKLRQNGFYRSPGRVIGAVNIEETFPITGDDLNEEFAAQCGLTLDGLKEFMK